MRGVRIDEKEVSKPERILRFGVGENPSLSASLANRHTGQAILSISIRSRRIS